MILIFDEISNLAHSLDEMVQKKMLADYRLILRINNRIDVLLLESAENLIQKNNYKSVDDIYYITSNEVASDEYYKELFSESEKLILKSRRFLSNLLEISSDKDSANRISSSKIVTFYSYKGGVGRSTTLASCASYLAHHYGKKIVVIDCDFEAPGFSNFYLDHPNEIVYKDGLIEYLSNKNFDEEILVADYCTEIGVDYCGAGSIHILHAGNLGEETISNIPSLSTPKKQYLEGMSRIQMANKGEFENNFKDLIESINKELKPDLIFIDSRTGFNDVFGLTALNISDIVLGFFGDNAQTLPGLNFFIEKIGFSDRNISSIIVNSICSSRSRFNKFQTKIENLLISNNFDRDKDEAQIAIKVFPIMRYPSLESIGVTSDSKEEFLDFVQNKRYPEYNELFEYLNEILEEVKDFADQIKKSDEEENPIVTNGSFFEKIDKISKEIIADSLRGANEKISNLGLDDSINVQRALKRYIKTRLKDSYPKLYGEHSTEDMLKNIYYRKSMEDIFNHSKFILLGNKGTGKTFLYEALKIEEIVKKLQNKAQKKEDYVFFHLIDSSEGKFIDTLLFDDIDFQSETFYHKFWIVYIWNSIMLESEKKLGFKSSFEIQPINNDYVTSQRFLKIINDGELFIQVETELRELDNYLKKSQKKQNLIVIFDGLDQIVKPSNWHYKIVPLINYWRHHTFSKISPKLFLRSDLFERLSNITNVKELKNQSISIEWNQQELFAYFFKLILKSSGDAFLKYMLFTRYISFELVKQIHQKSGEDQQIPLDEHYLKPMVEAFFGKFADSKNSPRYGESYDWFYRNLKNANNTISLRPFIDLLDSALYSPSLNDTSKYPILPANYYIHGEARKDALANHFDDLIKEKGNEDLGIVCKYIREKKSTQTVYLSNPKFEFDKLLKEIIEHEDTESKTVDQLINMLKLNGVISEHFTSKGVSYSFALLYKYYLGLKTKPNNLTV